MPCKKKKIQCMQIATNNAVKLGMATNGRADGEPAHVEKDSRADNFASVFAVMQQKSLHATSRKSFMMYRHNSPPGRGHVRRGQRWT